MANYDSGVAFVAGFLFGGALGVALGMLLAPKSGAETREEIVAHGDALRQRAEDVAAQISHKVTPTIESLRDQATPAVDAVRQTVGMKRGAEAPDADSGESSETAETKNAAAT